MAIDRYVLCERVVSDPAGDLRTDRFPTANAAFAALIERRDLFPEVFGPDGTGRLLVKKTCKWCGLEDCPDPWAHMRLDAMSETTWRRR